MSGGSVGHNFNPRLREGGDQRLPLPLSPSSPISIHASEKEATAPYNRYYTPFINFNPRLREGGDPVAKPGFIVIDISIHASEKEATALNLHKYFYNTVFQSTPPRRRRLLYPCLQITLPHDFNPRLREGGDIKEG